MASEGLLNLQSGFDEEKFFEDYKNQAQSYLDRDTFKGTPITGEMLANSARATFKKHGKIIPVDFALTQAQFESAMGREGRNPKTNPYNVGEFDEGTKQTFKTTSDGVDAYYDLMAKDYLRNNTTEGLLNNFVNYRGDRYASNKKYEKTMRDQSEYVKKYIANRQDIAPKGTQNSVSKLSGFEQAFADAKSSGKKTFSYGGKLFKVEMK